MINRNECPACGEYKAKDFRLCTECHEIYGDLPSEWPSWLREQVNSNRRVAYEEKVLYEHELSLGEFVPYDGMEEVGSEELKTRVSGGMAWSHPTGEWGDPSRVLAMPWAPYDNEEDNIAYRRANNIRKC